MKQLMLAVCLCLVFGACTAKDVAAGAQLIACIDENLDLPVDQLIAKCGPDAAPLIEGRKVLSKKRNPCTTIVVEAGAPTGPGR